MDFIDTNVVLYSVSSDPAEFAKSQIAETILREREIGCSVQVL